MLLMIMILLAALCVAAVRLAKRAVEAGHLLVLRPHGDGVLLFERDGDGRYHHLPLAGLPAALRRFACGVPSVVRARADGK